MTIVIAKIIREEILIVADTMVAEPGKTGPDVMPGRLKAVTIAPRVTVAYAGNADAADVALRTGRREFQRAGLPALLDVLKQETCSGQTDFLVAAHTGGTSLLRIRNGVPLEVNDLCALGDTRPFGDLIEKARLDRSDTRLKMSELRLRFIDRLMTNKELGDAIGGFPICLELTPDAHRYLGHTGTYTYKFPNLVWGKETEQPMEQVYTGDGHFQCSVMPSKRTDVPVLGVCLLQARTGYVYSPLQQPQAFRVPLAPSDLAWEGHEQEMYDVLRDAIEAHVAAVMRDQTID